MKSLICLVIGLGIVGGFSAAWGQQGSSEIPPLPEGPLVKKAPDFSSWQITCRNGGSSQGSATKETKSGPAEVGPSGSFKELTAIKTGGTVYEKVVFSSGEKSEAWYDKDVKVALLGNNKNPIVTPIPAASDIYRVDYKTFDFPGLGWISKDSYVGVQELQGRKCIVFRSKISTLSVVAKYGRNQDLEVAARIKGSADADSYNLGNLEDNLEDVTAWIDIESRLPVAASFGKEARFYQFGAPPSAKIILPPALAAAQKDYLARVQQASQKPKLY